MSAITLDQSMPPFLIEPVLRCPYCRKTPRGYHEIFAGALMCENCRRHWWATVLEAGVLRRQLLDLYNEQPLADALIAMFRLPESIDERSYWQIQITGREFYRYTTNAEVGPLGRSAALLRRIVGLSRLREARTC